ncbi:TRAP transporter small permease [Maritimibacter sp. DP1N21-5]|uniref:TRAP transporter small permease n=1 Tax=Maritimibacter sp. DP1N21-5 TaxID=2836867 RepID=UPI001C47F07C|nr:TRAP transporter small permease [Maritimibacter sp. DP1N21-5]MBV7410948.1 TRAP transporter small permease [Maritimibacter sp. DP1N21-5]
MTSLIVFVQRIARIMGYIGALAVIAMMLHISLDVLLRNLFRYSMNTVPEIVARYYMTAVAFLPLGWLEFRRQMISVEVIEFALTPRLRRFSDASVMAIAAVIYGYLAYTNWDKALSETRVGTLVEIATYKMPVWHSFYFAPVGFTLATIVSVLMALGYLFNTTATQIQEAENEH